MRQMFFLLKSKHVYGEFRLDRGGKTATGMARKLALAIAGVRSGKEMVHLTMGAFSN
jgi:hypothetical protein